MKKIAIIVDSSCGLTKEQANKLGWYFLPLNIEIDGINYLDGIEINSNNIFEKFSKDSKKIKTSSTIIGHALELMEKLSKEYEKVVVFPISKYLSGQNQNLIQFANEFKNVYVIKSLYVAQLIILKIIEFLKFIEQGISFEKAIEKIETWDDSLSVTLMPKYNDFLVKGGRLTPSAAALAKLFKIIPMIKFEHGKLQKEGKGRVFSKTVISAIDAKANLVNDWNNYDFVLLTSNNPEINYYKEYIKNTYNKEALVLQCPSVISIHTGPEAIAVILINKILNEQKQILDKI
ncbi:DegV family protein [Mycoplasmopsis cricetuli]|uniref:DegV family protein n=1 Tax=Mycoplasmopsis cricetuli TaxID=171283 RepID=UPI0004718D3D|nr:DegV family protein [Mycoplasmopsis cricetuli]